MAEIYGNPLEHFHKHHASWMASGERRGQWSFRELNKSGYLGEKKIVSLQLR